MAALNVVGLQSSRGNSALPHALPSEASPGEPKSAAFAEAMNAALVVNRPTAIVGLIMGTTVLGLTFAIFLPSAPRFTLAAWGIVCCLLMAAWLVAAATIPVRPSQRHVVQFWTRVTTILITVGDGAAFASIWLLFPFGDYHQRLYVTALHAALMPSQIICCPAHIGVNRTATIALFGSLVLMFALIDGWIAWPTIAFLVLLTAMQLAISGFVRDQMRNAVLLRLAGEELRQSLEIALASVISARDAKARFIAAASHDLGQPLQAAALFFDQATRAECAQDRNRAADGVQRALATGEQMIARMLDHMQLEAGAVEAIVTPVAIGPLLMQVAAQHAPGARLEGSELRVVASSLTIITDPSLLERALGNLIGNAIRHSQGGRILIGARRRGHAIRIYVVDDGRGVAPSEAAHIFDDYYRGLENAGNRGGFGLGLASVRRIAALLGGLVGIDQRWSDGAAFYLELPLKSDAAPAPSTMPRSGSRPRAGKESG
jgi:signal transduction histidine kinase